VKRWMVVAALGLAAAGGIVAPGAAQASSSSWYQVYQADAIGSFNQTAVISSTNIWSVGDISTGTKPIYKPFIRHFNGSSWQAVTIPDSSGSTSDWVTASSASNVWIGGVKDSPIQASVVYQWNGAHWTKIPVPGSANLQDVTALAPNNVWAFSLGSDITDTIFHWNGSKWRYYLSTSVNFVPQGLSASAPDDVWASGYERSGSKQEVAAYRWNGTAWDPVSMPHPAFDNGGPCVTTVSPSNVWIGWADNTASHALHFDGSKWHTVTTPNYADPYNIVPDGDGGYWFGATAILTGSTWTVEQVPPFTGCFGPVTQIPGTTSALMNAGVQASGSSNPEPTIFRFDL
jgi:hypothetical protein